MFELWKFIKVFCIVLHISMRHLLTKQFHIHMQSCLKKSETTSDFIINSNNHKQYYNNDIIIYFCI